MAAKRQREHRAEAESYGSVRALALALKDEGRPSEAARLFETCFLIAARVLETDGFSSEWEQYFSQAYDTLAQLLEGRGNLSEAQAIHAQAEAIYDKVFGPDNVVAAESLSNLARILSYKGDHGAARQLYERVLEIHLKQPEPYRSGTGTAGALTALAHLLSILGDNSTAKGYLTRAIDIYDTKLGIDHPRSTKALSILALILFNEGQVAKGLELSGRAAIISEQADPEHPRTLAVLFQHAQLCLHSSGRYQESKALIEKILPLSEKINGAEHPWTIAVVASLAHMGIRNSCALLTRVLTHHEQSLGPNHPDTATALCELARAYRDETQDYDVAEDLLKRAIKIRESVLGHTSPSTAQAKFLLARMLQDIGRHEEAVPLFREAIAVFEKMEPNDALLPIRLHCLSSSLREIQRFSEAILVRRQSIKITERQYGKSDRDLLYDLLEIAEMHQMSGAYDKAEPYLRRARSISEKNEGQHIDKEKREELERLIKRQTQRLPTAAIVHLPNFTNRTQELKNIEQRPFVENVLLFPYIDDNNLARGPVGEISTGTRVGNSNEIRTDERGIPLATPLSWRGKRHSDIPLAAFFRQVWGKYLKHGLTFADIKRLDKKLANSIKRHLQDRLHWPADLNLPNERRSLQAALAEFRRGNIEALTPKELIAVGRALKRQESSHQAGRKKRGWGQTRTLKRLES